jgi:GT2 family glycosyltransferase
MKDNIVVVFSSHLGDEKNQKFIKHIDDTIGVKHQTVCYTNYNEFSLPEVYNKAIKEYNNEKAIFIFCHPDIFIKTRTWGRLLLSKFNALQYSIIGVAGTTFLADNGCWWTDRTKMFGIVEHTDSISTWVSEYSHERRGQVTPVVLVDGVFMAVDCNNIEHQWDEEFKGFHLYDLSFCVPNYLDGCNIGVTTDIRILHQSVGMTNEQWEKNRIQFVEKYKDELPITLLPPYKEFNLKLTNKPKVSVIIPTKNNLRYLINNLNSWDELVQYSNYEILIADTGSGEDVIKGYDEILSDKVKLIRYDWYNFGKINNDMVKNHVSADTELILFCNDDVKLLNDALSRCVEIYNQNKKDVGTIGIRLHYGDGSVQHNGITIYKDYEGKIKLSHRDLKKLENYQTGVNINSIGNTGAFLLINKDLFLSLDGFPENYLECLEDVELNLRCKAKGLKNITISDAVAYHYESVSRNKFSGGENRFMADYFTLSEFIKNNNIQIK